MKYMLTKVAKRFYCIRYLVRARINPCDIVVIYCSGIRSILEYACPVWHPGLSKNAGNRYRTRAAAETMLKINLPSPVIF